MNINWLGFNVSNNSWNMILMWENEYNSELHWQHAISSMTKAIQRTPWHLIHRNKDTNQSPSCVSELYFFIKARHFCKIFFQQMLPMRWENTNFFKESPHFRQIALPDLPFQINCGVGQNLQFTGNCPLSHTEEVNPYFTFEYKMEEEKKGRKGKIGNSLPGDEEREGRGCGRSCGSVEKAREWEETGII